MIKKLIIILGIIFSTSLVNAQVINLRYNLEQATVLLVLIEDDKDYYCTGVVLKNTPESSEVLTAKHCVKNSRTVLIGNLKSNNYKVAKFDDLAIVYFNNPIPNKLATKIAWDNNKKDDKVYTCGFVGHKKTYEEGKIVEINWASIVADFKIEHGNSGSGVFNEAGELVGIVFAFRNSNNFGVIEPLKDVKKFLNNLE